MSKPIIAVALSGGVDSAVAAALLKEQGNAVIGIFMKNWSDPIDKGGYCPWVEDQLSARMVAQKLAIPFYTFNFEHEYRQRVLDYFFAEYKAGRTPNPDVMCNREIKFDLFAKKAALLGATQIATGHYARKVTRGNETLLMRGRDHNKDQSYFLWILTRQQLGRALFPLGDLCKPEVRTLAKKLDLPNWQRKDSQGVCFVGPIDVGQFLREHIRPKKGLIVDGDGQAIGEHDGVFFYTIGQRHGLHIDNLPGTTRPPLYVQDIDVEKNQLTLAPHDALFSEQVMAGDLHWLNNPPKTCQSLDIQVRYRQAAVKATISALNADRIALELDEPIWAVTPGQSLVIYDRDIVLGGGIIEK